MTAHERQLIYEALIRNNKLDVVKDLDLTHASAATDGYSGA